MNAQYEHEGERPLSDYDLVELQEYVESILTRFKAATDKEVRKILKAKWKELTNHYNARVRFEAYNVNYI